MAFASSNQLADLNAPLNRSGGNAETRYNWQLNAHNHAADFYFESIGDSGSTAAFTGASRGSSRSTVRLSTPPLALGASSSA